MTWSCPNGQANPGDQCRAKATLFERIPAMMHSIDSHGRIVAVSDLWLESLRYTRQEVVGRRSTEFLTRESRRYAEEEVLPEFLRTGCCENIPYDFVKRDGEIISVLLSAAAEFDAEGDFVRSLAVLIDVTEWRRQQEALNYRQEFERLITTISTRFVNVAADDTDREIKAALEAIGHFSRVDRSWVFLVADGSKSLRLMHEWCSDGVTSLRGVLDRIETSQIPWGQDKLRRLEAIHIPSVAALPPEASVDQRLLEDCGSKSLVVVPMSCGGVLYGFLGFDSVHVEKTWDQNAIRLLRVVGEIFTHALERRRAARELQRARDALEERVTRRTRELAEANQRLASDHELLARKNAALEEMLDRIDRSQEQITARIRANIDSLALPVLGGIERCADEPLRDRVALLRSCLGDLSSSFAATMEAKFKSLSPREIEICNLVRSGMSCKEIAGTLNTSVQTVLKQRKSIRRKLGLKSRSVSLVRHLKRIR